MNDQENTKEVVSATFNTYRCNLCDTVFSVPRVITNFGCAYCGSKNLTTVGKLQYSNYKFLPFIDTVEDAKSNYKSKIRFNPLLPFAFRKKSVVKSIRKVYFPCLLYNVTTEGDITFFATDKIKNVNMIPKQKFDVKYQTKIEYNNILNSGFSKIDNDLLQEINEYNYSVLDDLNVNKLRDACMVPIDVDINKIKSAIEEDVMKQSVGIVRSNVNHQLKKLNENNMQLNFESIDRVMVPVLFTKITYKEKDYLFLMNGHTGKFVLELTTSKVSTIVFGIILFLLFVILISLVLFIF